MLASTSEQRGDTSERESARGELGFGAWRAASGRDAVAATVSAICGSGAVPNAATAEGLALAGRRSARLPTGAPPSAELRGRSAWVLHAVRSSVESPGTFGAFELVAASHQEAVDHCLVGQILASRLGKAGICSIEAELADGLGLYRTLGAELAEPLLTTNGGLIGIAQAARAAFEDAARATGRPLSAIDAYRVDGAKHLIVAVGVARTLARRVVDALRQRGFPFGAVGIAMLRPFPAAALAPLLRDRRVAVMTASALDSAELAAGVELALALGGGAQGAVAHVLAEPDAALASLAEVFGLRPEAAAPLPEPAPAPSVVLAAAPAGARADALLLEIAAIAAADAELSLWRPPASDGLSLLAVGKTPHRCGDTVDVLIAGHPQLLLPSAVLGTVRKGGTVLVGARADSARALAEQLSGAQRELFASRELELAWFDVASGAGQPPAEDTGWNQAWRNVISAAAAAVARGLGKQDVPETDPGGVVRAVDAAELARAPASNGQLTASAALPVMPEPAPEAGGRWMTALRRFHVTGRAAAGLDSLLPLAPAATTSLVARDGTAGDYPLVLRESAGVLEVVPLRSILEQVLGDLARLGEPAPIIESHLDRFVALAAAALRGQGARPVRPLLDNVCAQFAEAFSLSDTARTNLDSQLAALSAALPDTGQLLGLGQHAHIELYAAVMRAEYRRRAALRIAEIRLLVRRLRDVLEADSMNSPEAISSGALAAKLGSAASVLLDMDALAIRLTPARGPGRLEPTRRSRIEATLTTLERQLEQTRSAPELFVVHAGLVPDELELGNAHRICHAGALGVAAGLFDGLAEQAAELFRALRIARLELAGAYEPGRHDEALSRLDWQAFTEEELRGLTPLVVVEASERVWATSLDELSALLRSGRPVHVLVEEQLLDAPVGAPAALGYLLVAHREAVVVQSTLALPEHLARGFAQMARALRPAVSVIAMRPPPGPVPAWLRLSAAHEGRALPCFRYDPDAGHSWAECFEIDANPDPEQPWPRHSVVHSGPEGDQRLELSFTFADAVALDANQRRHFHLIPAAAWSDDQIELATWLAGPSSSLPSELPFIWVIDEAGKLARAIVSRELAFACRERLRIWRILQELGGAANEHARRAALAARAQTLVEAEAERDALARLHAEELERVRNESVGEAMDRLARALLDPDSLSGLTPAAPRPAAAAPSAAAAPKPEQPAAAPSAAAAAPAPAATPEEEVSFDDPFIDTPLCTTCNECTQLNPTMFKYNADKQAFIADARAGTFLQLVTAAEKCPAECIHPGKPRNDDSSVNEDLLTRAAKFN
jgi:ferredoxin